MIEIQKATIDDIDVLVGFQQNLAAESERIDLSGDLLRKGMTAMLDDPSKGLYYIAKEGQEIIGCHMITYEWSDWRNGTVLWLQSVYVKEGYRKKGVFKMMYENLIAIIKQNPELVGLRLYVDKSNTRAMKAYESMGMDGAHYTVYEWMKNK